MSEKTPDNRGKDIWARFGQTLKTGAETILQETKGLTRTGKLRLELLSLENERDRTQRDAGKKAFTLWKEDADFPAELVEILEAVADIEGRIQEKKNEIEEKAEEAQAEPVADETGQDAAYCPSCGAQAGEDDLFCRKCGGKLG